MSAVRAFVKPAHGSSGSGLHAEEGTCPQIKILGSTPYPVLHTFKETGSGSTSEILLERHAAGPRQHLQPPPSTPAARHSRKSSMRSSQLRSRIILLGAWVMGLGRGFCSVPPSPRPAASSPLWIVLPGMHLQAVAPTLSADDTPPGCSCKGGPGRSRPMRRGSEQPPIFRGEGLPSRSRRLAGTYPAPAAQSPIASGPRHFAGLSAQPRGSRVPHRHCRGRSASRCPPRALASVQFCRPASG